MSIPYLPSNLTHEQYEHLSAHLDLFRMDKGDDIIEYFTDLEGNPRYYDLYERVCDDLGLPRVASQPPPRHRREP